MTNNKDFSIAIAIPCYNEAATIAKVVGDFRAILPDASVHVFDNNSTDGSSTLAENAGAVVHPVHMQGKGNVIRAIFDTLDEDVVILVDGDDTYFPEEAPLLLKPVIEGEADMVVGNRLKNANDKAMVKMHQFGNRIIVETINRMFDTSFHDILSGYRVFSRNFIECIPILKPGFETETELTLQALENGFRVKELPISYRNRPAGSLSKLRSFHDGFRIMSTATTLLRDHQPMRLFGSISLVCLFFITAAALLRMLDYLGVQVLPTTLVTGTILLFSPVGMMSIGIGLILSAINSRFREMNQLMRRNKHKNKTDDKLQNPNNK